MSCGTVVVSSLGMSFEREHVDGFGLCHIYALTLAEAPTPQSAAKQ